MKIQEFLKDAHKPAFHTAPLRDINPLGGTDKIRLISAPNKDMRLIHQRFVTFLRRLKIDLSSATGCRPGCSPIKNVELHRYNRYIYITDIHAAYPSVDGRKLATALLTVTLSQPWEERFRLAENEDQIFEFLKRYCLKEEGGLYMGAPSSPDQFNIYCAVLLDVRLREIAGRFGLTYSRYLDDLIFSSPDEPIGKWKRKEINTAIRDMGFTLSDGKTRIIDLAKRPIVMNGVGLELGGRMFLQQKHQRRIKGLFRHARYIEERYVPLISGTMGVFHGIYRTAELQTGREKEIARLHESFKARNGKKKKRK